MKHLKKIIAGSVIGVIVLALIIFGVIYYSIANKPFTSKENVNITIESGESFYGLLDDLSNKNLIKNETLIKLYVKLNGITPKITPGVYTIPNDVSLKQFINILNTQDTIKVVIPEGYTIEQIADTFQKVGLFSKEEFLSAVQKYPLPSYVKKEKGRRFVLEGYLFPDTYEFARGEEPDKVIKTMIDEFQNILKEAEQQTGVTIDQSQIDNIVTKASVIEREANTFKDMQLVSGVIDNRLAINMPLQIDATVIYALGKHVDKVYYKDLDVQSPYNTYLHKGLPIGPICNPGIKAIEAALKPAKTNAIYYILNGKEHYFTDSYQKFLEKKEELNKTN